MPKIHMLNSQLGIYLLASVIFAWLISVDGLFCYSCSTSLPSNVDQNAQIVFRVLINAVFKPPPASRFCNQEKDVEFKTIHQVQCSSNDECVKFQAINNGLDFVVRGCKSMIFTNGSTMANKANCGTGINPSLCYCQENLCNYSDFTYNLSLKFTCFSIILGIVFKILFES